MVLKINFLSIFGRIFTFFYENMFSYPNIIVFEKIVNLGHEIFEFLYIMFIYGRYIIQRNPKYVKDSIFLQKCPKLIVNNFYYFGRLSLVIITKFSI